MLLRVGDVIQVVFASSLFQIIFKVPFVVNFILNRLYFVASSGVFLMVVFLVHALDSENVCAL